MDDEKTGGKLAELYRSVGADAEGRLKGDGSHTLSTGEEMPFLFTRHDADPSPGGDLPGTPPFRRGIHPTMYRGRLWTMRQYAGFGDAEATNRRFKYLLDQGQTGLSTAFDLPTQMGLDSDDPLSVGEVGRVGVAIDTVDDLARVFEDIPLDQVSVSMTINATAPILLAMLQVVAEERGIDPSALAGTTQNDVLKEYVARGTYIYPPGPSLALAADLIAYCAKHLPRWNPISISGYHIREAGSDSIQEVGFTLADGLAYVRAAMDRGLDVDRFAPRLSFFFGCHNHFLEEVAKFRAARVAWATLMKERIGAKDPRSMALRFHTQTAGCTLTAQQPENNVVRVAIQALAAVLGGTQSLHTNAQDEALSLPTEKTARVALRTQQIIGHESHVTDFVDPLGGSWAIESLTDHIIEGAMDLVDTVDSMGGMVAAIESGFVQREIENSAYRHQLDLEAGRERVVGVNCFMSDEIEDAADSDTRAIVDLEAGQKARLAAFREQRSSKRTRVGLDGVVEAAKKGEGVVEAVVEAVRARATVGEVSSALGEVFGRHRPE
ncbi:MAG: methylmalonyl-CoA mutase [Deltaproteobacteria bacterium]|nr:methylmalonyl-CoA mutase [Deltaproteobacteria bacterium]